MDRQTGNDACARRTTGTESSGVWTQEEGRVQQWTAAIGGERRQPGQRSESGAGTQAKKIKGKRTKERPNCKRSQTIAFGWQWHVEVQRLRRMMWAEVINCQSGGREREIRSLIDKFAWASGNGCTNGVQ